MFHITKIITATLIWVSCLQAEARPKSIAYDAAVLNPDDTEFSLIQVGASTKQPYMVAGHLILRAKSPQFDATFDWGIFNPDKEDFFIDYIFGRLNYKHIVRPFQRTFRNYQKVNRSLKEFPLRLSNTQKQEIISQLVHWAKPENRIYRYDIFFKNCATVIGNLLVEVLNSKNSKILDLPAGTTIREAGLSHLAHFPGYELFTDIVMGGMVGDQPISKRGLFFLPVAVPKLLQEMAPNAVGTPQEILSGTDIAPVERFWSKAYGVMAIIIYLLMVVIACSSKSYNGAFRGLIYFFLVGSGIIGCVIGFLTFFSEHRFAVGNWSILFFWPVDGLFIFYFARKPALWLKVVMLHIAVAILAYAINLTKAYPQDLSMALLWSTSFWFFALLYSYLPKFLDQRQIKTS
jgi:hypothetical protein